MMIPLDMQKSMHEDEELFEKIFVSSNFTTVFFTQEELHNYLDSLRTRKELPKGISIVFIERKLSKPQSRREITNATPDQIQQMIDPGRT